MLASMLTWYLSYPKPVQHKWKRWTIAKASLWWYSHLVIPPVSIEITPQLTNHGVATWCQTNIQGANHCILSSPSWWTLSGWTEQEVVAGKGPMSGHPCHDGLSETSRNKEHHNSHFCQPRGDAQDHWHDTGKPQHPYLFSETHFFMVDQLFSYTQTSHALLSLLALAAQ